MYNRSIIIVIAICCLNYLAQCNLLNNRIDEYLDHNGKCALPDKLILEIQSYQPTVNKIATAIVNGSYAGSTYTSLADFVDKFGPRMSGSESLENAIDYMLDELKRVGLENVHTENASVPHWTRGFESASLTEPHKQTIEILGLGTTVGTPRGGIISDVVVVESFAEFEKVPESTVQGKIVVFAPKWESYGKTVAYRRDSASVASKKGAIAALVRSITPFSIGSPHTGMQAYQDGVKQIPVACITVEDAEMLLRIYRRGDKITIRLEMEDRMFPTPFASRNTISELQGTSTCKNQSVVVVSGHLDSWDVGVGAMDDGGGAFISWKAIEFLMKMNLRPRRTIRSILWTGEEQGIWGGQAYANAHKANEKNEFNFFFESDIGTFEPTGLDFTGNADAQCIFKEILKLMTPLNATKFSTPTDGGPDIEKWTSRGFPGASLLNKNEKYFWFHHSAGDSMLLENSENLDKATALFASAAYIIADLSINIPNDL